MKKNKYFNWFTWRFIPLPEELSVKSILETVLYLLLFLVCFYLFTKWNHVPEHEDSIQLDCLSLSPMEDGQHKDIAPVAEIVYCIPMTTTGIDSVMDITLIGNNVSNKDNKMYLSYDTVCYRPGINFCCYQWTTQFHQDEFLGIKKKESRNDTSIVDSILIRERNKTIFWKSVFSISNGYPYAGELSNTMFINNEEIDKEEPTYKILFKKHLYLKRLLNNNYFENKDSLIDYFKDKHNYEFDNISDFNHLYYFKSIISKPKQILFVSNQLSCNDSVHLFESKMINKNKELAEWYILGKYNETTLHNFNTKGKLADGFSENPSWFRLEDISQAYYNISLDSWVIDSIKLRFEFIGATEFSKMQPVPDKITMSSIEFSDPVKILDIKLNGLKFHAKFTELENKQYIRMFVVTALLSGMIMIFIALFFSGIIKYVIHQREKRQHNGENAS